MQKKEVKKRIQLDDLQKIPEDRHRTFMVSYVPMGDVRRYYKKFQKKRNVIQYLQTPNVTKIKLYKCDVIPYESEPTE